MLQVQEQVFWGFSTSYGADDPCYAAKQLTLTTVVPMMTMAGAGSMMAEAMTNVESALAVGALGISQSSKLLGSILLGGSTSSADDDGQQKETSLEIKGNISPR